MVRSSNRPERPMRSCPLGKISREAMHGFWAAYGASASIICSSSIRSNSIVCLTHMCSTSTMPGRIKGSGNRYLNQKVCLFHQITKVARFSPCQSWVDCIITTAEVREIFQAFAEVRARDVQRVSEEMLSVHVIRSSPASGASLPVSPDQWKKEDGKCFMARLVRS
jgi:hypothetical protein